MSFAGLLLIFIAHYLSGRSVVQLFKLDLPRVIVFFIAMIIGVPIVSLVPCILQLLHVPITALSVKIGLVVLVIASCIPLIKKIKPGQSEKIMLPKLYEWPYLLVCSILLTISVWRCFYYPPIARDMLSGPELLAKYTVKERTMINSVFSIDLHTTNNYFKSPFITGLQIIYKLLVCPFGQVWLSILSVSFIALLFLLLRRRVHPVIAGFLLVFFLIIPDLYAYSYLMLYDYSNMIFFFGGYYFLSRYITKGDNASIFFSAFLFGIATYIRTETLVLVIMTVPLLLIFLKKKKAGIKKMAFLSGVLVLTSAVFYVVCNNVFVGNFVPVPFNISKEINTNLGDLSILLYRLRDISTVVIFSPVMVLVYGYFIYAFCVLLIADVIIVRKFNTEAVIALYGIVVVYTGLALLGYVFPLVDLLNTTKRGLFKILPLMLLYMANSGLLRRFSDYIYKQETAVSVPENVITETAEPTASPE